MVCKLVIEDYCNLKRLASKSIGKTLFLMAKHKKWYLFLDKGDSNDGLCIVLKWKSWPD